MLHWICRGADTISFLSFRLTAEQMSSPAALCKVCQSPAPLKCSGCLAVSYCDKKHQREDWSKHRPRCRAYEIRSTPELGRHLIASRDLQEDEKIIICEFPFVVGPRNVFPVMCCVGCCRLVNPLATFTCAHCQWPVCSPTCSGLVTSHRLECALLRGIARVVLPLPYHVVLPLRCLLLQTQNPKKWRWIVEKAAYAEVGKEDMQNDALVADVEPLLTPLSIIAPDLVVDSSPGTVRKLLNVLDVNALDGSTGDLVDLGGLYGLASLLQQNCAANTSVFFKKAPEQAEGGAKFKPGYITVKAARKIRKGEILTRSSGYVFFCTILRFRERKMTKNLRCCCSRCKDPHENSSDFGTLRCVQCSGWVVPINADKIEMSPWKCESCGKFISASESADIWGSIAIEMRNVIGDRYMETHVAIVESFLSRLHLRLHTNHMLCFAVKCYLLKMYGLEAGLATLNIIDLERKAALGHSVVDLMAKLGAPYLSEEVSLKAQCYLELASAEAEILRRKYSSGVWDVERVARAATECKAILRRILSLVAFSPSELLESEHQRIVTRVGSEKFALACWMKKNGLVLED